MDRRILYLCTTFPRLSETFVEREVRYLRERLPLEVHSLWRGGSPDGIPVRVFRLRFLFRLFLRVPAWLLRDPSGLVRILETLLRNPPRSLLSVQETHLGLAAGILLADEVRSDPPRWIHAVWATAPATAAWTIHCLTGARFSFGAHAYDLFQHGGDCLLREKIAAAAWIRTSTAAAARELERRGAPAAKIVLVRRGLASLPDPVEPRDPSPPLRALSVGRLVPKKGFRRQIELYRAWKEAGVPFEAVLVGDGPLRAELEAEVRSLGLGDRVFLPGALPASAVGPWYRWADLFLFTGAVSRDGDRDGLPNVVPEAMAHGLPVLATPSPGVREAVRDGETGVLLHGADPKVWAVGALRLWHAPRRRRRIARQARAWVEENFRSAENTARLAERLENSP